MKSPPTGALYAPGSLSYTHHFNFQFYKIYFSYGEKSLYNTGNYADNFQPPLIIFQSTVFT